MNSAPVSGLAVPSVLNVTARTFAASVTGLCTASHRLLIASPGSRVLLLLLSVNSINPAFQLPTASHSSGPSFAQIVTDARPLRTANERAYAIAPTRSLAVVVTRVLLIIVPKCGIAHAKAIAMIASTTSNSISVTPLNPRISPPRPGSQDDTQQEQGSSARPWGGRWIGNRGKRQRPRPRVSDNLIPANYQRFPGADVSRE